MRQTVTIPDKPAKATQGCKKKGLQVHCAPAITEKNAATTGGICGYHAQHFHIEQGYQEPRGSKALAVDKTPAHIRKNGTKESGKTVLMRVKTDAVDYKYFCEPNITPIHLSDEFVQDAIDTCPELYDSKKERYLKAGLSDADANVILANPKMAAYFEEGLAKVSNAKDLANFLIVEINSYLNKNEIAIENLKLSPLTLGEIVSYQEKGGLSHKQCTDILNKVLEEGCSPEEAKNALHIVAQVSDSSVIMGFVTEVLDKNPQSIQDFKNGNQRVLGFLVGQIMKASHGKVNPAEVSKTLRQELDKR